MLLFQFWGAQRCVSWQPAASMGVNCHNGGGTLKPNDRQAMRHVGLSKSKKNQPRKQPERAAPRAGGGSVAGMVGIAAGKLQSIVEILHTQETLTGSWTEKNNQRFVNTFSSRSGKNQRRDPGKKTQSAREETAAGMVTIAAEQLQSTTEPFPIQETLTGSRTEKNNQRCLKARGMWSRMIQRSKTAERATGCSHKGAIANMARTAHDKFQSIFTMSSTQEILNGEKLCQCQGVLAAVMAQGATAKVQSTAARLLTRMMQIGVSRQR